MRSVETGVRADVVRHLVISAESVGVDARALLSRSRLPQRTLDEATRIPVATLQRLWTHAAGEDGVALPARVAERLSLDALGPFGFALLTAPTAHASLAFAARHYALIRPTARWSLHDHRRSVTLTLAVGPRTERGAHASVEAMTAYVVGGLREIVGPSFAARRVRYRHAAPRYHRALAAFLRCPIEYEADADAVEFSREPLDEIPRLAHAGMHAHFAGLAGDELRALTTARPLDRVRRAIEASLVDGAPSERVARELGLAPRTLRRLLEGEGTSLRALRDELRAERALAALSDPKASIVEVATLLGFSEERAFARAFRRWHAEAPSRARKR